MKMDFQIEGETKKVKFNSNNNVGIFCYYLFKIAARNLIQIETYIEKYLCISDVFC